MIDVKNKSYLLVFVYWLILQFLLEGLTHFFSFYRFFNIIENLLFIGLLLFIVNLIRYRSIRRFIYGAVIVFIGCMIWLETVMYLKFKIHFGPSSYFVFLNTNKDELWEFVHEYVNLRTLVVTGLFFIPLFKLRLIIDSVSNLMSKYQFRRYQLFKTGLVVVLFLVVFKYTKLIDQNLPYLVSRSIVLNHMDEKYINDFNAEINTDAIVSKNLNSDRKNTFVVLIGESTTSAHMGLYGYYRNTTPFLNQRKDSLNTYLDVISPNTSTFHSLSKALTLGNYENPEKTLAFPVTQLFNKSGFKTFWISNHSPAFNPSSALARVSNHAQSQFFNSKGVVMNNLKHDGEILDKVFEAFNDEATHKIIFVHLIGAHFSYENRYPKEFDVFKDKPNTQFTSDLASQKINTYDNAIKYSDFIINQVLEKLKSKKENSYLMYFSDHGEEVYQEDDFYGHLEARPTRNTFKIPLVMWYNDDFNYPKDYFFDENRKYMTDDLWHSIAHISGLKSKFIDGTRSIFSSDFANRKRLILGGKDYETIFK